MIVTETRMFRWMSGVVTREDRIRNEYVSVASIVDEMRENRLGRGLVMLRGEQILRR